MWNVKVIRPVKFRCFLCLNALALITFTHMQVLLITHLPTVRDLTNHNNHAWIWNHRWAASKQRLQAPPAFFLSHAMLGLRFSFLQLGDSSQASFSTVTVPSVSYGQFWGVRVKWELTSEIVIICCCVYYYLLYHSGFIHINFLPFGLWFPIWSGIFLFRCLYDLRLFPDNNNISIINFIILPLKRYSRQIGGIVCNKRNAPL